MSAGEGPSLCQVSESSWTLIKKYRCWALAEEGPIKSGYCLRSVLRPGDLQGLVRECLKQISGQIALDKDGCKDRWTLGR